MSRIKVYAKKNRWANVTKRSRGVKPGVSKVKLLTKGACYEVSNIVNGDYFIMTDFGNYQCFKSSLFMNVSQSRDSKLKELGI